MIKRGIILCSFIILCSLLSSPVWAEFKLIPSISLREEYDDNIYLRAKNGKDDFITTIIPSLSFGYDTDQLRLSLDYSFIAWFYLRNSEENQTTHNAKLEANVAAFRDILILHVSDIYERETIDQRRQVVQDNRLVNTTDSNRFIFNPYLTYPLSTTLKVKTGYKYENIWYKDKQGNDEEVHSIDGGFIKELSQTLTTSVFYIYSTHNIKSDEISNYDRQDVTLGVNYQLTQHFLLNGSYGRAWIDYKEANDDDSAIWDINSNYNLTETISFKLGYSQNIVTSVDAGINKSKMVFASIEKQGPLALSLKAYRREGTYLEEERKDELTGILVTVSHPITPNIKRNITGTYEHYKFLPEKEKADRYGVGISLDYTMRILTISLGYNFDMSNSSFDYNDYKNNRAWVQAKITL